jgi:hypothetical protein
MDGFNTLLAVTRSKPEALKRNVCFWSAVGLVRRGNAPVAARMMPSGGWRSRGVTAP